MSDKLPDRAALLEILASFGDRDVSELGTAVDSLELAWVVHLSRERYGLRVDLADPLIAGAQTVDELAAVLCPAPETGDPSRAVAPILVTGMAAVCALGTDLKDITENLGGGQHALRPVTRFDASRYRTATAGQAPGNPELVPALVSVIDRACDEAGLSRDERAGTPLIMAAHYDTERARLPREQQSESSLGDRTSAIARKCGLSEEGRTYVNACVASNSALADAFARISSGRAQRCVVAAGYLVDEDNFALFDAAGAMASDGRLRPFSTGRKGMVLGDGVAAVVVESSALTRGGARPRARVEGWGQAGDAYHVTRPDPRGAGMARAISRALERAGAEPASVGYVNAHGTGTEYNDPAETAALFAALGQDAAATVPVSSTKSLHGHPLVAAGLLELVITVLSLENGLLPVNSGYLGPDAGCGLDLVLESPRPSGADRALTLNSAFGGAHGAIVVGAP